MHDPPNTTATSTQTTQPEHDDMVLETPPLQQLRGVLHQRRPVHDDRETPADRGEAAGPDHSRHDSPALRTNGEGCGPFGSVSGSIFSSSSVTQALGLSSPVPPLPFTSVDSRQKNTVLTASDVRRLSRLDRSTNVNADAVLSQYRLVAGFRRKLSVPTTRSMLILSRSSLYHQLR